MYVCGPTAYDFAHIGNARPAVVFDVLYRVLKRRFDCVSYARNFTDVDDKINAAAKELSQPIGVITDRYIDAYHADMAALGVLFTRSGTSCDGTHSGDHKHDRKVD